MITIRRITAVPLRLPRNLAAATGTAGSPTTLAEGQGRYRWSEVYPCLYSTWFETALVRVETSDGLTGWGEAQAPLAPEVACSIIDHLLAPVLLSEPFDGSPLRIAELWERMYSTMRVRGQTGGFMLDAISAIDIALWDLAGKRVGAPVAKLIAAAPKTSVPAYLSGIPRGSTDTQGFTKVKLFFDTRTPAEFFAHVDAVQAEVAVDALWRLTPDSALTFGRELDARNIGWFEAPLPPEDPVAHAVLARQLKTPLALGESYRTHYEMAPFFREAALGIFQPDLGRCGITEGLRMAAQAEKRGVPVVPHISIAFGPQLAAALQFAAAAENCVLAEYNPTVVELANRFLATPIRLEGSQYLAPTGPGLGIEFNEAALTEAGLAS